MEIVRKGKVIAPMNVEITLEKESEISTSNQSNLMFNLRVNQVSSVIPDKLKVVVFLSPSNLIFIN